MLVKARVQFNSQNLQGIRIPGADLSYGVFDHTQLQEADLRGVTLQGAWLRGADLSRAKFSDVVLKRCQLGCYEIDTNVSTNPMFE